MYATAWCWHVHRPSLVQVEFFKINFAAALGEEKAWDLRFPVYLGAAACAEFIADVRRAAGMRHQLTLL